MNQVRDEDTPPTTIDFAVVLVERTREGRIAWKALEGGTGFRLTTKRGSTEIVSVDEDGLLPYQLRVYDPHGTVVETLDWIPSEEPYGPLPNRVMADLYSAARRSALNIDTVIRGILDEIDPEPF